MLFWLSTICIKLTFFQYMGFFYARNHPKHTLAHEVCIPLNYIGTGVSGRQNIRHLDTSISRRRDISYFGTGVLKRRDTNHFGTGVSKRQDCLTLVFSVLRYPIFFN